MRDAIMIESVLGGAGEHVVFATAQKLLLRYNHKLWIAL